VSTSGFGNSPTATLAFLGPVVTVTVGANQKVSVVANKALGSTAAAGALDLDIWMCSQLNADPLVQHGAAIFDLRVPQNTRVTFGLSWVFTGLAPGTYNFGLCGLSSNFANWNSNEFGYTSALTHL
jgi:hypothetical protein